MNRVTVAAFACLAGITSMSCNTEVCACSPVIIPALVTGRVIDEGGASIAGAQVHAFSAPALACHSLDAEIGFVEAGNDGSFRMELRSDMPQDSVCVLVFARPPG